MNPDTEMFRAILIFRDREKLLIQAVGEKTAYCPVNWAKFELCSPQEQYELLERKVKELAVAEKEAIEILRSEITANRPENILIKSEIKRNREENKKLRAKVENITRKRHYYHACRVMYRQQFRYDCGKIDGSCKLIAEVATMLPNSADIVAIKKIRNQQNDKVKYIPCGYCKKGIAIEDLSIPGIWVDHVARLIIEDYRLEVGFSTMLDEAFALNDAVERRVCSLLKERYNREGCDS